MKCLDCPVEFEPKKFDLAYANAFKSTKLRGVRQKRCPECAKKRARLKNRERDSRKVKDADLAFGYVG